MDAACRVPVFVARLILTRIGFRPPPLVFTDNATLLRLGRAFTRRPSVPLVGRRLPARLARHAPALAEAVSNGGDFDEHLARAINERGGVRGPVLPIGIAGTAVAVLLVAGTGWVLGRRRRRGVAS